MATAKNSVPERSGKDVWLYLISRLFDWADLLVQYGIIPFFFYLTVKELAGHTTIVNVVVNYFSKGSNIFPWALSGSTVLWAVGERKLRQKKTSDMSSQLAELESRLDPGRSSSGLTSSGQTPKKQKKVN